jgi:hypothetical protein
MSQTGELIVKTISKLFVTLSLITSANALAMAPSEFYCVSHPYNSTEPAETKVYDLSQSQFIASGGAGSFVTAQLSRSQTASALSDLSLVIQVYRSNQITFSGSSPISSDGVGRLEVVDYGSNLVYSCQK